MTKSKKQENGHSIIEILVALAVFSIYITAIFYLAFSPIGVLARSKYYSQALQYLNQGEEALRSIAANDFSSLSAKQSGLEYVDARWRLSDVSDETIGNYRRSVTIEEVYRLANGELSELGLVTASEDSFSRWASIEILWEVDGSREIRLERKILLVDLNNAS